MKSVDFNTNFRFNIFLIIVVVFSNLQTYAQADTIFAVGTIQSHDFNVADPVNFPLQYGKSIGDINGDGIGDFVFVNYVWNELTNDLTDKTWKSAVVTNINNPKSAYVFYNAKIIGVGDYNGDGFDDMIDIDGQMLFFGNAGETSYDSLDIVIPEEADFLHFHGDISGDGKSDFILGKEILADSLFMFSFASELPKILHINDNSLYPLLFHIYDYDEDNLDELLIVGYSSSSYNCDWFIYDSISGEYISEFSNSIYSTNSPNTSFSSALSDINGDGLIDICHVYFNNRIHLESCFGNNEPPYYFDNPIEIEVNNNNRFLYHAGDFNNDGADDWYSKIAVDTIVLYYGNNNIAIQGFIKESYFVGDNKFVMPITSSYSCAVIQQPDVLYYNDDSIPDLIFNFWNYDEFMQFDTIGMAIYLGNNTSDLPPPQILGSKKYDAFENLSFGGKVKNTGDFNNDGYDDWAILSTNGCFVNIYYGADVLDYEPDKTILLPQYINSKCFDMAFGDLNADGWIDMAISNSSISNTCLIPSIMNEKESIYIFFGSSYIPDELYWYDADIILEDAESFYSFGRNLAIPGDYNSDGYNDLVVGGGKHKNCMREAFVYYGGEQLSLNPDLRLSVLCSQCGISFATPITSCGDINDDGYHDFTIGDPENGPGKSQVYYGGPNADSLFDISLINYVKDGYKFGYATPKTEGDFNNDGYSDIAQWNINDDSLYIYLGGSDFNESVDIFIIDTLISGIILNIEFLTNFSEIGKSDIIGYGGYYTPELYVFTGCNENKYQVDFVFKNSMLSVSDIASGDFNNDGYTDVMVGNQYAPVNGWAPAGVVQHYISPIMVDVENKPYETVINFTVTPNPTQSIVYVLYSSSKSENITITLANINGVEIYETQGVSNISTAFSMNNLSEGIYFISVKTNSGILSKKVIKTGLQ